MKKILVIEDEGIIRLNLLQILSAKGFNVIGAENGLVGLRLVKEFVPDLIVCNVKMPGLTGYEVFTQLRSDATTAAIPFIFLTATIENEDFLQGEQRTNIRFLDKPFLPNEFLDIVAELLGSESS